MVKDKAAGRLGTPISRDIFNQMLRKGWIWTTGDTHDRYSWQRLIARLPIAMIDVKGLEIVEAYKDFYFITMPGQISKLTNGTITLR
jgi:hypothetical protein